MSEEYDTKQDVHRENPKSDTYTYHEDNLIQSLDRHMFLNMNGNPFQKSVIELISIYFSTSYNYIHKVIMDKNILPNMTDGKYQRLIC